MDMVCPHGDGCDVVAAGYLEDAADLRRAGVLDQRNGQVCLNRPAAQLSHQCRVGPLLLLRAAGVPGGSDHQRDPAARPVEPVWLATGTGDGHQLVARTVSLAGGMAEDLCVPYCGDGAVRCGPARTQPGSGCTAGQARAGWPRPGVPSSTIGSLMVYIPLIAMASDECPPTVFGRGREQALFFEEGKAEWAHSFSAYLLPPPAP